MALESSTASPVKVAEVPARNRVAGFAAAFVRFWGRTINALKIPAPETALQIRRIQIMEREIMLPIKAVGILMIYSFYLTSWTGYAHTALEVDIEAVITFFWIYVLVNIVFAALLLRMKHLPPALMQWVVFVMILGDGLFLSALTLVTGGYQSILYWLFLGLILRSAVSVPKATSQILLNSTIIICYVLAGIIDISIEKNLEENAMANLAMQRTIHRAAELGRTSGRTNAAFARGRPHTNIDLALPELPRPRRSTPAPPDWNDPNTIVGLGVSQESTAEPLVVRLVLLVLMTLCAYGIQVLLERQRHAEEEAREFGLREGQLRSAGRLAAEFAHQIKNPLAIINNASYSLQRALKEGKPGAAEQLRIIQEEVEHSDRIITQIMGYAQLSEGRVEKLDVVDELEYVINRVFPPAAGFAAKIHRDFSGTFPPLLMQRRHFRDSLSNVLQNAREALDGRGGNIWVSARCHQDYSVEVAIADDGVGIAAEKHGRIFEPYYTTKEKGTGVGLATVKHNVELYGGSIRVESELGKGARFILLFPARTLIQLAGKIENA
jgi:signal transduction histidine kinase